MRDILTDLQHWLKEDRSIALATVIQTWGSSSDGVGSMMAFTPDRKITGSVSEGCVENAVIDAGLRSMKTNRPQPLHFGVTGEAAWEVGLAYVGALVSKSTNAKRRERLSNDGLSETQLSRLHAPNINEIYP